MKRVTIFIFILALGVPRVFSYSPVVGPDLKYLPAILDSTLTYNWDSDSGKYLSDIRRYFYEANGNLITAEVNSGCFIFHGNHYDGDHRFSFSYDAKGQRIMSYAECLESEINNWIAVSKKQWTYDVNGNQIEIIKYDWNSGLNNWVASWKMNWSYDDNGNQIEEINYEWRSGLKDWVGSGKMIWSYDDNGNQIEEINYEWRSDIRDWVGNWKWNGTYDEDGNLVNRINYSWDSDLNNWVGSWKTNWSYDENRNHIEEVKYEWSSVGNDWIWVKEARTEYTYDKNGNLIEYMEYYKDTPKTDWIVRSELYAYWSELTTSIRTGVEDLQCLIYPNPAKDYLIIETSSLREYLVTVHSQNGQQIIRKEIEGSTHQLDLSSFEPGVYFITIRSKDFVTTRKIIKW